MENEHLNQRLRDLRAQDRLLSAMSDVQANSQAQYRMGAFPLGSMSLGVQSSEDGFSFETLTSGSVPSSSSVVNGPEEDGDIPRKKVNRIASLTSDETHAESRPQLKRIHTSDQHVCVTCGRTDSPEWRKVGVASLKTNLAS